MSLRFALLLAAVLVAGIGVGWLVYDRTPDATPEATTTLTEIPTFSLADIDGNMRSIDEWNEKPMLLNFWATWCAPCRREMPLFQAYHESRGDELQIIGVAIDRLDDVQRFVAETGVQYPILVGQGDAMAVADSFGLDFVALPFTIFADPAGRILKAHIGEVHAEHIDAVLEGWQTVVDGGATFEEVRENLSAL